MEEESSSSNSGSPTSLESALRLKRNSKNLAPISIKKGPVNAVMSPNYLHSPLAKEFLADFRNAGVDETLNKKIDNIALEEYNEELLLKPDIGRASTALVVNTPIEIIKETPYEENDSSEVKAKTLSISSNEDLEKKIRKSSVDADKKHDDHIVIRDRSNSLLRKSSVSRNHTKILSNESEPEGEMSTPAMRQKIGSFLRKHFPNKKHESDESQGLKSLKAILLGLENKVPHQDEPEEVSITSPLAGREHKTDHLFEKLMHHKITHPVSPTQLSPDHFETSPRLHPERSTNDTPEISPRLVPTDVHLEEKADSCEITCKSEEQSSECGSRENNSNAESRDLQSASESREGSEWHFPKFIFHKNHEKKSESAEGISNHPRSSSVAKKSSRSSSMSLKFYQHEPQMIKSGSEVSLSEKYGPRESVLGKGANATVRIAHKREKDAKWFAIKEFRKKKKEETEKDYIKKLVAEFCISSSLHHPNVVETIDLIKDEHGRWCEVMEYCPGGDLLVKMTTVGFASTDEMFCLFKQLLLGVDYLHKTGVAHRDLKPENLLLDAGHRFLKITDFGVSTVFRTQFEKCSRKIHGLCGSGPYIAPEEWVESSEYLPTKVDIWAVGIIFYSMLTKNMLWVSTKDDDINYTKYLKRRETGFPPFEMLDYNPKMLLYHILDPDAAKRPEANEILKKEWVEVLNICEHPNIPGEQPKFLHQHLSS
ncbi:serine/threonine-protein kinase HAL4/sat4 [Boothiomyces sp. JEL0866]|nr:serine/threonine-protein kinase HAL4/sat4 [Boothiomyces sp. JEL0866]